MCSVRSCSINESRGFKKTLNQLNKHEPPAKLCPFWHQDYFFNLTLNSTLVGELSHLTHAVISQKLLMNLVHPVSSPPIPTGNGQSILKPSTWGEHGKGDCSVPSAVFRNETPRVLTVALPLHVCGPRSIRNKYFVSAGPGRKSDIKQHARKNNKTTMSKLFVFD